MKIKRIELPIQIDFTKEDGTIFDNIILAGENGCGKTQLLNIIYDFSELSTGGIISAEKRKFTVALSSDELLELISNLNSTVPLISPTGEFEILQDFTTHPNYWN